MLRFPVALSHVTVSTPRPACSAKTLASTMILARIRAFRFPFEANTPRICVQLHEKVKCIKISNSLISASWFDLLQKDRGAKDRHERRYKHSRHDESSKFANFTLQLARTVITCERLQHHNHSMIGQDTLLVICDKFPKVAEAFYDACREKKRTSTPGAQKRQISKHPLSWVLLTEQR